jgi:hypothetical protein
MVIDADRVSAGNVNTTPEQGDVDWQGPGHDAVEQHAGMDARTGSSAATEARRVPLPPSRQARARWR